MEEFTQLFGNLLAFVYHCFDRIVIHGYLSGLSRPEQVVYFVRQVLGLPVVNKEVLSQRTGDYRDWVEAYARNHHIPMEWAEKGVRKEDYVSPRLNRLIKNHAYGVYFIFKSMEQGRTFRISVPKYPTPDPNYRILAHQRSRFTHYYFYIRDEVLGPIVLRVASFFPFHATYWLNGHSFMEQELNRFRIGFHKSDNAFLAVDDVAALQAAADRLSPQIIRKQLDYWTFLLGPKFSKKERSQMNLSRFYAITQIEYCRNFIFKRHFPIHKIFERSCEIGLWRLTANRISEIFGVRLNKRLRGKLATVLDQIEHGHHVFRAYWKNAFLKQYEKFARFLRNELCSNNLRDFGLKKGLIWTPCASDSRPLPTALPASRPRPSMSTSTSHCCSAWPCPSPSARSAIPESRSTTPASSVYSRFCSMAAIPSAVGPQNRSTKPSSPPFSSHPKPTASTSSATICANSGGTVCCNAMAPAMPTGSPQKAFRSHSCFCSSTSASAAPWPTAAFTTLPTQLTLPTANSSLPITKPTRPSRTSSTYSPLHDVTDSIVEVFLFKIFDPRI